MLLLHCPHLFLFIACSPWTYVVGLPLPLGEHAWAVWGFVENTRWTREHFLWSLRENDLRCRLPGLSGRRKTVGSGIWDQLTCPQVAFASTGNSSEISQAHGVCTALCSISWRFGQRFQVEAAQVCGSIPKRIPENRPFPNGSNST